MANEKHTFAAMLRDLRSQSGWTQEELAERAGLSTRAISDLERGVKLRPHRDTVERLGKALKLPDAAQEALAAAARPSAPASDRDGDHPLWFLPIPPNPLVGREREIVFVTRLLLMPGSSVLTLTGTGGTGKTRLAIEIATRVGAAHFGQVVLVSLGALTDARLVGTTIAHTMEFREFSDDQLIAFLARQRMLLVLDNFEHLLDAAPFVADLVAKAPNLTILITSRAPLGIAAERLFPVAPLPRSVLLHGGDTDPGPAIELFVQRTLAVRPDLDLSQPDMEAIAEICDRLDGLPLAIELAAARCRLLSPRAIAARLERRLPLLTTGGRDAPPRHQTLRSALAWSYDLLSRDGQMSFRHLSVFRGGFTFDAAIALERTHMSTISDTTLLDRLTSLSGQSLIEHDALAWPEARFTMLETVREYGVELLEELNEMVDAEAAHAAYYERLAAVAEPELVGAHQLDWFARLECEHANLRAAIAWLLRHEPERGRALAGALIRFWDHHGHRQEGLQWLAQALDAPGGAASSLRGKLQWGRGTLALVEGEYEDATRWLTDGAESARVVGDLYHAGFSLNTLGTIVSDGGDLDRALALHEEGLMLLRHTGDKDGIAALLGNVGYDLMLLNDLAGSIERCEESLALYREIGSTHGSASMLSVLGQATLLAGKLAASGKYLREGLHLAMSLGNAIYQVYFLHTLAALASAEDRSERAALLFGATDALMQRVAYQMTPFPRSIGSRFRAEAESALGTSKWVALHAAGSEQPLEAMIERALGME